MAILNIPTNLGFLQGTALGFPYLFPFGSDQPKVYVADADSGQQVWEKARIMGIRVDRSSVVMQHPVEDGTSIMDDRVINPRSAEVRIIIEKDNYRDVYSDIVEYFTEGRLVELHSRTGVIKNMVVVDLPHEEDPDIYDAISMTLTLTQMTFVTPAQGSMTTANVADAKDANTIKQGQISPGGTVTGVNTNAQQQALEQRLKGGGK